MEAATATPATTKPNQDGVLEQKIRKLRELYADAPEFGRAAFEKGIPDLKRGLNSMDLIFCNLEGWPGIHHPSVKDFIANHQVAAEAWYVASPNLTVAETRRLEGVGKAVEEFLDQIG